jgi:hypothetical protein
MWTRWNDWGEERFHLMWTDSSDWPHSSLLNWLNWLIAFISAPWLFVLISSELIDPLPNGFFKNSEPFLTWHLVHGWLIRCQPFPSQCHKKPTLQLTSRSVLIIEKSDISRGWCYQGNDNERYSMANTQIGPQAFRRNRSNKADILTPSRVESGMFAKNSSIVGFSTVTGNSRSRLLIPFEFQHHVRRVCIWEKEIAKYWVSQIWWVKRMR